MGIKMHRTLLISKGAELAVTFSKCRTQSPLKSVGRRLSLTDLGSGSK